MSNKQLIAFLVCGLSSVVCTQVFLYTFYSWF